jgi:hypothetical protein
MDGVDGQLEQGPRGSSEQTQRCDNPEMDLLGKKPPPKQTRCQPHGAHPG